MRRNADERDAVQAIAKLMNDNFVNIKVDKEVRSDVDRVYMTYVQVIQHLDRDPPSPLKAFCAKCDSA